MYSSSKTPHTEQFLSSSGLLIGLTHLPDFISNLCEDILNLLTAWLYLYYGKIKNIWLFKPVKRIKRFVFK